MDRTHQATAFIRATVWDALPEAVQHQSKRCLLDILGAMLAGRRTPVAHIVRRLVRRQFKGAEATILGSEERVSAAGAALANGFAANALDIDDGYRLVKGHPGACVVPPILAAGEIASACSGKQFLEALVVGYELGIRAGMIRHATASTYHASGSWGAVAGAGACGKLLGLDEAALRHALGAAEYHAPIAPMMKGIDVPSMGKDSIGWGCMVALLSALMAQDGFTGIRSLFDDTPQADWIDNLGQQFEILNLYFKPYAACRWAQPAIAGALYLVQTYGITPEAIDRIQVRTFAAAARLPTFGPQDTEQAQYNLAFPVAAALIDGEVGPDQVLPPRLYAPEIRALAARVEASAAASMDTRFPAQTCAEVTIDTHSGQSYASGTVEARWEPPDSLPTDEELQQKFNGLVEPVLGRDRAKSLANLIWHFEEVHRLQNLIDLMRG